MPRIKRENSEAKQTSTISCGRIPILSLLIKICVGYRCGFRDLISMQVVAWYFKCGTPFLKKSYIVYTQTVMCVMFQGSIVS